MEFLKLMHRMEQSTICQIVMATHSPMLMAFPNARLLRLSKYGLEPSQRRFRLVKDEDALPLAALFKEAQKTFAVRI